MSLPTAAWGAGIFGRLPSTVCKRRNGRLRAALALPLASTAGDHLSRPLATRAGGHLLAPTRRRLGRASRPPSRLPATSCRDEALADHPSAMGSARCVASGLTRQRCLVGTLHASLGLGPESDSRFAASSAVNCRHVGRFAPVCGWMRGVLCEWNAAGAPLGAKRRAPRPRAVTVTPTRSGPRVARR